MLGSLIREAAVKAMALDGTHPSRGMGGVSMHHCLGAPPDRQFIAEANWSDNHRVWHSAGTAEEAFGKLLAHLEVIRLHGWGAEPARQ